MGAKAREMVKLNWNAPITSQLMLHILEEKEVRGHL